jgi:orotate phosphoribosyltransferase
VAVLLALDRQERGQGERSAVQEVEAEFGLRCISLLTLGDLIDILAQPDADSAALPIEHLQALREYRKQYGIHS